MVYVLNINGKPIMPTSRYGKVRRMLNEGKAKVVNIEPFTIQLLYRTKDYVNNITLKVDEGSKVAGFSASTNTKELYSSEVEMRNDIVDLISARNEFRKGRRYRKTRYRKPRFNNRIASKPKNWLPPSAVNKLHTHIKEVAYIISILPITTVILEGAAFDIQKIVDHDIVGKEYQDGVQKGFENVREYVLYRDKHMCQCCKGKSKDKVLNVHHIESRKTGGNSPDNLITLCKTCHNKYHQGKIILPTRIKKANTFRDAAFMSIMRIRLFNVLKEMYPFIEVRQSFGYITKTNRIEAKLPKQHRIDALCIESYNNQIPCDVYFYKRKIRCHNRKIHKANILKSGKRKLNQAPFEVKGYRLFDKVLYKNKKCFIGGRRKTGYFKLVTLSGEIVYTSAKVKDLKLLKRRNTVLVEQRCNTYQKED